MPEPVDGALTTDLFGVGGLVVCRDVMQSYHDKNMQPQLIVHDCEASLTSLRMERGFVNRNRCGAAVSWKRRADGYERVGHARHGCVSVGAAATC